MDEATRNEQRPSTLPTALANDAKRSDEEQPGAVSKLVSEPDGSDADKPTIPGYDLLRIIGQGGMGLVWRAIEHRLDRPVALKVVRSSMVALTRDALWTEALVAARIGDPSIVRVLDVGFTLDERPYYAMELVEGTDLATLLGDGPLPPRKAIAIASDMARAAAAAHQHGVVHRDLKPRNVIIDPTGRARIVDFGIAFDSRRGEDPLAGRLAGSPPYMAPEQVMGDPVGPATDIHAIGVMLYEMLTGERPFVAATREELFLNIARFEPPPPSSKRESIHGDIDAVVRKCLMKDPTARFSSATALFETLSAILEGQRVDVGVSIPVRAYSPKVSGTMPALKPIRASAKKQLSWSWRLASSPEQLWPYVADTDRFNKAVGLGPVSFTDEARPDGIVKRTGEIRVLGLQVSWREYPFEWIRGREHAVFRWYNAGPISALWNRVSLKPIEGGGTELRHEIWLTPRGIVGHLASFIEIERKLGPAIDRHYKHLDEVLVAGSKADPFEAPFVATPEQRALVEQACVRLRAEGFDSAIIERLAMHLLTSPDGVMTTLRPYALADTWRTDRDETVDAFIHAARIGLLEPAWDVICPKCMIAHESVDELAAVKKHGRCTACATSFERDLRDTVELVFMPHPSIRPIERQTYCIGSPAKRPHIVAQLVLEPGEQRTFTVDLPRGPYRVDGTVVNGLAKTSWEMVASAVGFENSAEVIVSTDRVEGRPTIVRAGAVTFRVVNSSRVEETIRFEVDGMRDDAVSAARALTHPSFRSFFSNQLLAQGEHIRVRHLAFLFVELASREELFDSMGDGAVCADVARLDELVGTVAREHEGDVVPSSMGVLIVGFATSYRAVRAALKLRERLSVLTFTGNIAIAVHDGRCIALTRSGKPEFFGETLHRGESLLAACPINGLALSASIMSDRAVAVAVHESGLGVAVDKTQDGPYAGRRITVLAPGIEETTG